MGDAQHIRSCVVKVTLDFEGVVDLTVVGDHIAIEVTLTQAIHRDTLKTVSPLVAPKGMGTRQPCGQVPQQTHANAYA